MFTKLKDKISKILIKQLSYKIFILNMEKNIRDIADLNKKINYYDKELITCDIKKLFRK